MQNFNDRFVPHPSNVLADHAHQARQCPLCKQPIFDEKAYEIDLGDGLATKVHPECLWQVPAPKQAPPEPAPKQTISKSAYLSMNEAPAKKSSTQLEVTAAWLLSKFSVEQLVTFAEQGFLSVRRR
jgi:hypothetical protein